MALKHILNHALVCIFRFAQDVPHVMRVRVGLTWFSKILGITTRGGHSVQSTWDSVAYCQISYMYMPCAPIRLHVANYRFCDLRWWVHRTPMANTTFIDFNPDVWFQATYYWTLLLSCAKISNFDESGPMQMPTICAFRRFERLIRQRVVEMPTRKSDPNRTLETLVAQAIAAAG